MEPTGTNGRTRHIFQPFPLWWVGSRPVVVSRWMARNAVSCGHDDAGKAFCLRPLSGSRTATIGIVAGSVAGRSPGGLAVVFGFAVVMAQVRRPVPFRTRKLRPGCGDGTALERVWESSAPPHSFVGGSRRASAPGTPFFCLLCRSAGRSPLPGVPVGPFPLLGVRIIPRTGLIEGCGRAQGSCRGALGCSGNEVTVGPRR